MSLKAITYVLSALACASPAAADVVGKVLLTGGTAVMTRNNVTKPLTDGDVVEEGDLVRSADNGSLKIVLDDGSVLSLGKNSLLRVSAVQIIDEPPARYVGLDMIVGFLRVFASKSGKESRFDVTTRHAVTAVRGTEFGLAVEPSTTRVMVFEGEVLVCRKFFLKNASLVLGPGDQATATKNTLSTNERWTDSAASQIPSLGSMHLPAPLESLEGHEGAGSVVPYRFPTCRHSDEQFYGSRWDSERVRGSNGREPGDSGAGEKMPDPIPQ